MQINYIHPELKERLNQITLVRDCMSGDERVKSKTTEYLPMPNAADRSPTNIARYNSYVQRALFYNVTGRTAAGLVGQVFSEPVAVAVPELLTPLIKDVNGAGLTADQQSRRALLFSLAFGRGGLLVDYPKTAAPANKAQIDAGEIRPVIHLLDPTDVINWGYTKFGSKMLLSLVVIAESYVSVDNKGFGDEYKPQWRVLKLTTNGVYVQEVWRQTGGEDSAEFTRHEIIRPKDSSGNPWNFIPFTFFGPRNNDAIFDDAPLYDIAVINLAHYRNSADNEQSSFQAGNPTFTFSGINQQYYQEVLGGEIRVGGTGGIPLPKGGVGNLLQADPNTMPKDGMLHKEKQMVALGARLAEPNTQIEKSATEASLEETAEISILAHASQNISEAYVQAFKWASLFLGATGEIVFDLNTDYLAASLGAQEREQLIKEWQIGGITFEEYRWNLTRAGVANIPFDTVKNELDGKPQEPETKPVNTQTI